MEETLPILLLGRDSHWLAAAKHCAQELGVGVVEGTEGITEGQRFSVLLAHVASDADAVWVRMIRTRPELSDTALFLVLDGQDGQLLSHVGSLAANGFAYRRACNAELLTRLRLLLDAEHMHRALAQKERNEKLALELTRTLASSLEFREILFTVVRRIAEVVQIDRVSIVLIPEDEPGVGYVIAASDDHEVRNLQLDLGKYPEITQVLRTKQPLVIDDVATHPLLDEVRESVHRLSALSLIPIEAEDRVIGVLFLRMIEPRPSSMPKELEICHIIANATSPALKNALLLHQLREDHREAQVAHEQAEERARVERNVAAELRKTKEFLESLIEASVDAIVAADLKGTIILYNKGAQRIYGHAPEDVVGKLHVSRLYPDGVAKEVMRRIRSPEHGGVGRLESMHGAAVDKAGNVIPISLSAAMIYEHGEPTATVGIFTDLREKLLAEERLAQVQKKLEVSEKQALIAELAGTAAHELNQPLTSVMGYGELLMRRLAAGTPERNAAQVIMQEAERMADLVRKIGKITRYETKSYVGDQRILDLDRASDDQSDTKRDR
jgi:PAS domain S-box-containing protein